MRQLALEPFALQRAVCVPTRCALESGDLFVPPKFLVGPDAQAVNVSEPLAIDETRARRTARGADAAQVRAACIEDMDLVIASHALGIEPLRTAIRSEE